MSWEGEFLKCCPILNTTNSSLILILGITATDRTTTVHQCLPYVELVPQNFAYSMSCVQEHFGIRFSMAVWGKLACIMLRATQNIGSMCGNYQLACCDLYLHSMPCQKGKELQLIDDSKKCCLFVGRQFDPSTLIVTPFPRFHFVCDIRLFSN